MVDRKVVPFDEFYYQLKLMHLFQKHPVLYTKVEKFIIIARAPRLGPEGCKARGHKELLYRGVYRV
jgi:hypothetical protein